MLRTKHTLLITAFVAHCALASAGELDLTTLHNYASQAVPNYITKDNTPADNPITDEGATLGRVLFYDQRLSRNDTISCASCHQQDKAFGDDAIASLGVASTTGRHSMRLINARFADEVNFFWDERADSAETQATMPIKDHVEMGFSGTNGDPDFADLIEKLSALDYYQVLFTQVYGDPEVTEERVQRALAQFVRSIQSFDSRYDEGRARVRNNNADFPNFTASENRGKALFNARPPEGAGCIACHQAPEFDIDPNSRHNGVVTSLDGGIDTTVTRSPTLRDLLDANGNPHGPMMHDGSLATLEAVIDHYNAIPSNTPGIDRRLTPDGQPQNLNLTEQDIDDIAAFIGTLTGEAVYTDDRWSDPFNADNELSVVIVQKNRTSHQKEDDATGYTWTMTGHGVPGFDYAFQYSSDLKTWTTLETVTADANGDLVASAYVPHGAGNWFCRFIWSQPE